MKRLAWLAVGFWIAIGVYGVFYNITYIDEAKYLIKGWLITTGQVDYYTTPEFFYQHMPGIMLWYGLGQKIFGPSLLIARIQSFLIGLLVMFFSYKLAGKKVLPLLILAPAAILYYSAAVPQSLAALMLIAGFYSLFKNKGFQATVFFTLAFIVRENFLFTLIIYIVWPKKNWWKNLLLSLVVVLVFVAPGWPGTINVLKNLPGSNYFLPLSSPEKAILSLNWAKVHFSFFEYWRAAEEFGVVYFSFLAIGLVALWRVWKQKLFPKDSRWRLLIIVTGFNFLAHAWSAFNLSPRAIIPYFAYIFPLVAIIISRFLPPIKKIVWTGLWLLSLVSLQFASLYQPPNRPNTIGMLNETVSRLQPAVKNKEKILWLADPLVLYLSGRISYFPLINNANFFKASGDTATVKRLGFWNREMMAGWLNQSDLAVFDAKGLTFAPEALLDTRYAKIQSPLAGLNFYESK